MAFHNGGNIVTDGLVLALDASSDRSYNGSGTTWYDLSGNNRNARLISGSLYSSTAGGIFEMDGIDDTIQIDKDDNLINTSSMSIDMWVAVGPLGAEFTQFATNRSSGDESVSIAIGLDNRGLVRTFNPNAEPMAAFVHVGSGTSADYAYKNHLFGTTDGDSIFHHIVATHSPGETKLYYDGVIQHTNSASLSSINLPGASNSYYRFGNEYNPSSNTYALTGSIASVKIYTKALSAEEVLQNYNATKGRFD